MEEIVPKATSVDEVNENKVSEPKAPVAISSNSVRPEVKEVNNTVKKQAELEDIRAQLQSGTKEGLSAIESRLESQERFWKSKLRLVHAGYKEQMDKIRADLDATMLQLQRKEKEQTLIGPETVAAEVKDVQMVEKLSPRSSPVKLKPTAVRRQATKIPPPAILPDKPVPKPRKTKVESSRTTPTPPPAAAHHEYEEPKGLDDSDQAYAYSYSEPSTSDTELSQIRRREREERAAEEKMSQMDRLRNRVINDMSHQMVALGINPDGTEMLRKDMNRALGRMKHHRNEIEREHPAFGPERERVRDWVRNSTKVKVLEDKIEKLHTKVPAPPVPTLLRTPKHKQGIPQSPKPKSPLVKMMHAVRNCRFFQKKTPADQKTSTKKSKYRKLFGGRGIRKKDKPRKSPIERTETYPDSGRRSRSPGEASSSAVLVRDKKRRVSRSNRQLSTQFIMNVKKPEKIKPSPGSTKDVVPPLSWSSSELQKQAKEAILKSTIPIVPSSSQVLPSADRNGKWPVRRNLSAEFDASEDSEDKANSKRTNVSEDSDVWNDDQKRISIVSETETSDSDSQNEDRPSTALKEDDNKGQYVSLKPPETEIIVYDRPSSQPNDFGLRVTTPPPIHVQPNPFTSSPVQATSYVVVKSPTAPRIPFGSQNRAQSMVPVTSDEASASEALISNWDTDTPRDLSGGTKKRTVSKPVQDFVVVKPKPKTLTPSPSKRSASPGRPQHQQRPSTSVVGRQAISPRTGQRGILVGRNRSPVGERGVKGSQRGVITGQRRIPAAFQASRQSPVKKISPSPVGSKGPVPAPRSPALTYRLPATNKPTTTKHVPQPGPGGSSPKGVGGVDNNNSWYSP